MGLRQNVGLLSGRVEVISEDMNIKWIILSLGLVVMAMMAFIVEFGLNPRPIRVLNPTQFEKLEQIGAVVYRRLRQDLRKNRVLGLGDSPWVLEPEKIWNGFLSVARADGVTVHELRESDHVRPIVSLSGVKVRRGQELAADSISKQADGSANWFVGHGLYSELFPFEKIPQSLQFWITRFAVDQDSLAGLQPPCPVEIFQSPKLNSDQILGCAALRTSKNYLRKKLDPQKIWAAAEKHGHSLYLIFVYEPRGSR